MPQVEDVQQFPPFVRPGGTPFVPTCHSERRRVLEPLCAAPQGYYKQALAIFVEFNARYEQAGTYHQLGMVAQEQRRWAEAEGYYKQALAIKVEFNDRYLQAATYHQLGMVAQEQRRWA